MTATDILNSIL